MWSGQSMSAEPDAILYAKFLKLEKLFLLMGILIKLFKKKYNVCCFNKVIFSLICFNQRHNVTGWAFFIQNYSYYSENVNMFYLLK